ncbi:MAG: hypothetical protein HQL80_03570 [Magnetococcales bacterium]|nr:hypothetical protein [Magnetococcales bacterium]
MAILDRREILDCQDLQTVDVMVPEWGGTVRVRMMSGLERDAFEARLRAGEGMNGARALLVALCAVDEGGARLFAEQDAVVVNSKAGFVLDRIATVAMKLNRIGESGTEEAEKNSDACQTA